MANVLRIDKFKGSENYDRKYAVENYLIHVYLWDCVKGYWRDGDEKMFLKSSSILSNSV